MSYPKPDGPLLSKPVKRKTKKSPFLRKLEQQQKDAADAAHILIEQERVAEQNRARRVTSLSVAYVRRRDK